MKCKCTIKHMLLGIVLLYDGVCQPKTNFEVSFTTPHPPTSPVRGGHVHAGNV